MADRVQLLVKAEPMTQDEADQAKRKLAEAAETGRISGLGRASAAPSCP